MVKKVKYNRKVKKNLSQFLRCYQADVWGSLASSNKINKTSVFVYYSYIYNLGRILKGVTKEERDSRLTILGLSEDDLIDDDFPAHFLVKIQGGPRKRRKPLSVQGSLLKTRKKLKTFYGLLKLNQIRRHSKKAGVFYSYQFRKEDDDSLSKRETVFGNSFASLLEHRIDTILVRTSFVPSVFKARQMILHGKVLVGNKKVFYPSFYVPNLSLSL